MEKVQVNFTASTGMMLLPNQILANCGSRVALLSVVLIF